MDWVHEPLVALALSTTWHLLHRVVYAALPPVTSDHWFVRSPSLSFWAFAAFCPFCWSLRKCNYESLFIFVLSCGTEHTVPTITDNQSPPVLVIWFWHWKKCPKRSETAEMDPFNVKEKIGMSLSLKKQYFHVLTPKIWWYPLIIRYKYWKICNQLLFDAWVWSWCQNYKNIASSGTNKHTKTSI